MREDATKSLPVLWNILESTEFSCVIVEVVLADMGESTKLPLNLGEEQEDCFEMRLERFLGTAWSSFIASLVLEFALSERWGTSEENFTSYVFEKQIMHL